MEIMPSCPYCGCVLNFFDHYDCYDNEDKTLVFTHGDCPQCRRNYRWTEVYMFHHIEDLEEDT